MNLSETIQGLVKENKSALSNRDGHTPLFALAEDIANATSKISSGEIEQALVQFNISEFNVEEISTLNSFIYYGKINHDKISDFYLKFLKSETPNSKEDIIKRGLLLRFIVERDIDKITLKKIVGERELRSQAPWIWVDCISYYNWDLAVNEVSKILSENNNEFKNLLFRIPAFQKRMPKEDLAQALTKWYPNIAKSDRAKLENWATRFDAKIGALSITFLKLINDLPIQQKTLIPNE